jgi:hypothetical protein
VEKPVEAHRYEGTAGNFEASSYKGWKERNQGDLFLITSAEGKLQLEWGKVEAAWRNL